MEAAAVETLSASGKMNDVRAISWLGVWVCKGSDLERFLRRR